MNAEFQRTARRDKKAFFGEQCKEIEEKNRMRRTKDLFKKIEDIKGTFHPRMGMIKNRNGKDLTEQKRRWQKYTKSLNDPNNHSGVVTYLELDILECEVKWTLGSITMNKASGGEGIQAELFKLKRYLNRKDIQVLHSIYHQGTLESPLDSQEMKSVNPKGNQPRIFIGRSDAEAPILWSPDAKS